MEVHLTPDQEAFVRQAIERGRLRREEDSVQEALVLWEERERIRIELDIALDEAEADLETGHYVEYSDDGLGTLADELKRESRFLRDSQRFP